MTGQNVRLTRTFNNGVSKTWEGRCVYHSGSLITINVDGEELPFWLTDGPAYTNQLEAV